MARLTPSTHPPPREGEGRGEGEALRNLVDTASPEDRPVLTGSLDACFAQRGVRTRSRAPLELRGPFPGASYFLRNTTAGVFGGDAYAAGVTARAGSAVRVAGSSATKVYAGNGRESSLTVRLAVEPGAKLIWGPHATIVQAGASYRQQTALDVAAGGRAVLAEILVLGRLARGERFEFERLESSLDVTLGGAPVYSEAYCLAPGPDLVASMAGRGVLASVYAVGFDCEDAAAGLECAFADDALAGWSRLPDGAGLVARCLAPGLSHAQRLVERACNTLFTLQ